LLPAEQRLLETMQITPDEIKSATSFASLLKAKGRENLLGPKTLGEENLKQTHDALRAIYDKLKSTPLASEESELKTEGEEKTKIPSSMMSFERGSIRILDDYKNFLLKVKGLSNNEANRIVDNLLASQGRERLITTPRNQYEDIPPERQESRFSDLELNKGNDEIATRNAFGVGRFRPFESVI